MDLGSKPVRDFKLQSQLEASLLLHDAVPGGLTTKEEGLQYEKKTTPSRIRAHLLPIRHQPQHYKPDMVRAIGFMLNDDGKLVLDTNHFSPRIL